ncbi:MAG TPA: hypothetical protein VK958_06515 [Methylophilus sp.]|uniref:hypothetical protein n=1 Tax=Methylophilus sp. TaxID=29541 RepID=UPI002CCAC0C0|nr:hypothetical protein [Methylophilus sp.]HSH86888.1 hypothetical protein [Methylophilus sp.]
MARRSKSTPKVYAKDGLGMGFDSSQIGDFFANLSRDMQEKALRPAAFVACTVLYDELKVRVPRQEGILDDAIYRWRDTGKSGAAVETWKVGVNFGKAPHFHLVEEGHWQPYKVIIGADGKFVTTNQLLSTPKWIPPNAFFRPAYDAKINSALDAGLNALKINLGQMV